MNSRISRKKVVAGSSHVEISELSKAEEISGKLSFSKVDDKLMHSVLENDKEKIDEGKLINEAMNQGISVFTSDSLYDQLVKDYKLAEQMLGEKLIKLVSGYDPNYLEKNVGIPEFRKELKQNIERNIQKLKEDKLIDKDGFVIEKGIELASLILYVEELDNIIAKGLSGEYVHKKSFVYGERWDTKGYKKGDRYKDLAIKRSVKTAVRRGHTEVKEADLRTFERKAKGRICVIYAIDASGSMKGKKIDAAKKAGIALAYKAINSNDKVGLIVFGSEIREEIAPTEDFTKLLKSIAVVRASRETDFVAMIQKATELFPSEDVTKHLIIISDALPTVGKEPEKESMEAVGTARGNGITVSLIGIGLEKKGKELAKKIVEIGDGRLYMVSNVDEIDKIILEDYYEIL